MNNYQQNPNQYGQVQQNSFGQDQWDACPSCGGRKKASFPNCYNCKQRGLAPQVNQHPPVGQYVPPQNPAPPAYPMMQQAYQQAYQAPPPSIQPMNIPQPPPPMPPTGTENALPLHKQLRNVGQPPSLDAPEPIQHEMFSSSDIAAAVIRTDGRTNALAEDVIKLGGMMEQIIAFAEQKTYDVHNEGIEAIITELIEWVKLTGAKKLTKAHLTEKLEEYR